MHPNHSVDSLKYPLLDLTPRVTDSVDLGWSHRFCFSNKFPGDRDVAVFKDHTLRTAVCIKIAKHHHQQNGTTIWMSGVEMTSF